MREFPRVVSASRYLMLRHLFTVTSLMLEKRLLHCFLELPFLVCSSSSLPGGFGLHYWDADSSESFAMIRGGHIDVAILGVSLALFLGTISETRFSERLWKFHRLAILPIS
jgi:hypothetical protein